MPASGKYNCLGMKHMKNARCQFKRNNPATGAAIHQDIQHQELIIKENSVLQALLIESLQNHMTCAVGSIAGTADGFPRLVVGMPAKGALGNPPIRGPRERQTVMFQVVHCLDSLTAHEFDCILITQVITTFDRIIGMPLPVILFKVSQGGADSPLGRARVGPHGMQLAYHRYIGNLRGIQGCHQARPPGTDNYNVIGMGLDHIHLLSSFPSGSARINFEHQQSAQ